MCHLSTHVKLTEIVESLLLKEAIHFQIHQTISFAGFNDITCHHTSGLIMLQKTEVENLKVKIKRSVVCDHTDNKDSINWRVNVSTLFFLILRARGHMLFFSAGRKTLRWSEKKHRCMIDTASLWFTIRLFLIWHQNEKDVGAKIQWMLLAGPENENRYQQHLSEKSRDFQLEAVGVATQLS